MSWYNSSSWYKPNAVNTSMQGAEKASAPPSGKKNARIAAIITCVFIVAAGIWLIASGGYLNIAYNDDGYPTDWHDYMDELYGVYDPVVPADINIPLAEERGSLTLRTGGGSQTLAFSSIYEKCVPSVVGIKVYEGSNKDYFGWGSGVIASPDGYIITNTHVIDNGDSASVVLYDGSEYDAKLIGYDTSSDIALIKIDAEGLTAAEFASSSDLRVGDSVAAIGNPLSPDLRLTMTSGIISALNREINANGVAMTLIQTDASINEGNSGGPLFNDRGQVIGITNMKMISTFGFGVEGLGFAIPSDTIRTIVDAIISDGAVYGRSTIGITVGQITADTAEYYDIPLGLYVSYVTEGSDAEAQGIRSGDIITHVNGQSVISTQDIADAKESLEIGDSLDFTVWRDGKTLEFTVKLMDASDIG